MPNRQLPTLSDLDPKNCLPTGKHHVSFSELHTWAECSYKHKLKYVEQIDLGKPTIHTEYGHVIHNALEQYILYNVVLDDATIVKTQEEFAKVCDVLRTQHGVEVSEQEQNEFSKSISPLLKEIPGWFTQEFPGWSPVDAEFPLYESIAGQKEKYFKGFIDAIIKCPPKKKKLLEKKHSKKSAIPMRLTELTGEIKKSDDIHWIIDHKTTGWGWKPEQKRDFQKQLQLILYKHYYARIMGLDIKQVRCGFLLLKRTPKKSTGSHLEFVPVSVGPKTEDKALKTLNDMINQIQTKRTLKNRASCRFCEYSGTKWCY